MTPRDQLPHHWQQILNQIDAHSEAQQPDPPPAPIVLAFWLAMLAAWAGVIYAVGVVLGVGK